MSLWVETSRKEPEQGSRKRVPRVPSLTRSLWSLAAIDVTYLLEEGSGRKLRRRTLTILESSFRK